MAEANPIGRPTVMTENVVNKLEEVFAIGGTDAEACFYANISKQTLYDYQEKHPEFIDRKEALKEKPFLKARQTIVKSLDNPQYAFEYMKRKKKNEFSERQEMTGAEGKDLIISIDQHIANKYDIDSSPSSNSTGQT